MSSFAPGRTQVLVRNVKRFLRTVLTVHGPDSILTSNSTLHEMRLAYVPRKSHATWRRYRCT